MLTALHREHGMARGDQMALHAQLTATPSTGTSVLAPVHLCVQSGWMCMQSTGRHTVLRSLQVGGANQAEYKTEIFQTCFLTDTVEETEGGRM